MWLELFLCLMLAHLVADFVLQSNKVCKDKMVLTRYPSMSRWKYISEV